MSSKTLEMWANIRSMYLFIKAKLLYIYSVDSGLLYNPFIDICPEIWEYSELGYLLCAAWDSTLE